MITLLVMTDGRRDCITEAIASADTALVGPVSRRIIHDDSGDPGYQAWLTETFTGFELVATDGRAGFGGAIRNAWQHISTDTRFVFHLEDDFTLNRPVDLTAMADVLDRHPHLVQLALRRQPWNADELAAGGIVEQHPADFADCTDGVNHWLEHRRFFTTNPSLYRSTLCKQPWPRGHESEGRFTHHLLASPKVRFGYWGSRASGEAVTHIGHQRVGVGY